MFPVTYFSAKLRERNARVGSALLKWTDCNAEIVVDKLEDKEMKKIPPGIQLQEGLTMF